MSASRTLAVVVCLAVLSGGAAAAGCSTERLPNAVPASDAPFTLQYQRSASVDQTTFYFKICAKSAAQPLSAFRLRLADRVLQAPAKDIKLANPAGSLSDTCATGPGWWLRGPELGALSEAPKSNECELFDVTVYNTNGQPTPLSAICQQDVTVLGAGGKTVLNQATQGPSCLYSFELADGTVAVGALVDNEGDAVPPSPPSPRPPVPRPNPTPYYYGSAHARRLQQAPFVRPLLAGGADEPLAFATRRLMEASAVPLPRHLARLPGRQLSGYYGGYGSGRRLSEASAFGRQVLSYYGGYGSHRRSLMGMDTLFGSGRALTTYYYGGSSGRKLASIDRHLTSYGYYGSHRRSLMSVGQEGSFGRTLTSYYYGGSTGRRLASIDRHLTSYGYYGGHRRSLMSVGQEGSLGRALTGYGYYGSHRRSLASVNGIGRQLSSYYGGYGEHRRSLMSVGAIGRRLSYYGYQGHH
ncbi:hypothetical protein ABPG77_009500 [Micractinium sp. CCAP 211/92]